MNTTTDHADPTLETCWTCGWALGPLCDHFATADDPVHIEIVRFVEEACFSEETCKLEAMPPKDYTGPGCHGWKEQS